MSHYREQGEGREPYFSSPTGCVAWLLLWALCVGLFGLGVLLAGSFMKGYFSGEVPLGLLILVGVLAALVPPLVANGMLTWLRQRWNPEARFRESLLHVMLVVNTGLLLTLVIVVPQETARALKANGSWPFGSATASLLGIPPEHPALRAGRSAVQQMAGLLEASSEVDVSRQRGPLLRQQSPPLATNRHLPSKRDGSPPGQQKGSPPASPTSPASPRGVQAALPRRPPPPDPLPALSGTSSRRKAPPRRQKAPRRSLPERLARLPRRLIRSILPGVTPPIRLPFQRHENAMYVKALLHDRHPVQYLFDTGASYTTLSLNMAQRLEITPPAHGPTIRSQTANGTITTRVGLLSSLTLGRYRLTRVAFSLCRACDDRRSVGLLGLNVSRRFIVTIDYDQGEIQLKPRKDAKNRRYDIRPFLKYARLKGVTTTHRLVTRVKKTFNLRGILWNRAPLSVRRLRIHVLYLSKQGRVVGSGSFEVSSLKAQAQKAFHFQDPRPPNFKKYRLDLRYGEWDSPSPAPR